MFIDRVQTHSQHSLSQKQLGRRLKVPLPLRRVWDPTLLIPARRNCCNASKHTDSRRNNKCIGPNLAQTCRNAHNSQCNYDHGKHFASDSHLTRSAGQFTYFIYTHICFIYTRSNRWTSTHSIHNRNSNRLWHCSFPIRTVSFHPP